MRLGIIGLGSRIGNLLNDCFRRLEPGLEVVALIEPDPVTAGTRLTERERETVHYYKSVADMINQARLDAVAIGTRCDLHARYAIEAAPFGLPLYLEKPVAVNTEQAVALERAFKKSRTKTVVSFALRASPLLRQTADLIAAGAVGRVEHLLGINYVPYGDVYFSTWYRDYTTTQGLFLQKATHDFDYLSLLAGAPIVRVAAMASKGRVYRDAKTRVPGVEALYREDIGTPETGMNEDASSALLEFANGAQGVYTQVFYSRGEAQARGATISGLAGTLSFDWYRNSLRHVPHADPVSRTIAVSGGASHFGGDAVLAQNFLDVVRGTAESIAPLAAGLQSAYACLAAKESAETGRFVDVRQLGESLVRTPPSK